MNYAYLFLLFLVLLSTIAILIYFEKNKQRPKNIESCDAHSCKSIDPVSDPKYNMQQIVKQSILLEEHLANKNKYCRDCIVKHYMHIIGLAEEAQMLATNNIDKYPLINECIELYNRLFKIWIKNNSVENKTMILNCCDDLRTMRKKLIAVYFFDNK